MAEEEYRGVRIRDDPDRGLVQVFFPDMPAEKVRRYLKKHGFAWEPASGVGCVKERTTRVIMRGKRWIRVRGNRFNPRFGSRSDIKQDKKVEAVLSPVHLHS
jgi:hypothetical protein